MTQSKNRSINTRPLDQEYLKRTNQIESTNINNLTISTNFQWNPHSNLDTLSNKIYGTNLYRMTFPIINNLNKLFEFINKIIPRALLIILSPYDKIA